MSFRNRTGTIGQDTSFWIADKLDIKSWRLGRFRGPTLAVEFSNRLWRVSTAEIPQRRRRVNRGRLPSPILLSSHVAAWAALPETCFSTKQSRSVSRAVLPRIRKPGRGRRQRPRPRVPSLQLRFQPIHPREPVLPRNVDLLRRNAIYAGSPAASATGIARPRLRPSQMQHLSVDLGAKP